MTKKRKTMMTPSEEIKSIRVGLGLTWIAFAEKVGVSWRTVAYWESGQRKPSGSAMILIRKLKRKRSKP
jgi:DNA-binding transcriptional regulator YiaG